LKLEVVEWIPVRNIVLDLLNIGSVVVLSFVSSAVHNEKVSYHGVL
jgi:hypothetical protein